MARTVHRLTPAKVRSLVEPGMYGDGGGLWLHVGPTGGRSWVFRFMRDRKAREMGLGALHTVGLSEARERARAARLALLDGVDPLASKEAARAAKRAERAAAITFGDVADKYIVAHESGWRNAKHKQQWRTTIDTYVAPILGSVAVGAVDTGAVMRVLEPLWRERPETASRIRGRIESILDYARARGWRDGENPARWRGHIENLLPARSKIAKTQHHAALPWREIGPFMAAVAEQEGTAALALRFVILTGARSGEVLNATWAEIDLGDATWVIPASRMKAGREHRVPLSPDVVALLRGLVPLREPAGGDWVFPGARAGKPLHPASLPAVLERMKRADLTVHGFRSCFRDWAAESTNYPREVAEMALAHTIGDKVEAAYRRGDLFEKRRKLMEDWATYCARPAASGVVVPIRGEATA